MAFHGVNDRGAFAAQVDLVVGCYRPVSEAQVRASLGGGDPLPERAVWITFDDGDPSVVDVGLDVLAEAGVPATMYVCPGLIESGSAAWWTVVERAGEMGRGADVAGQHLVGTPLVRSLKTVADDERRAIVDSLAPTVAAGSRDALTRSDLERWVAAGFGVGNHTWDHPCLDHCAPEVQEQQISDAHRWLEAFQPGHPHSFAYPNGDHSDHAESVLVDLGYELALLFDHGLVDPSASPLRTSRLRLDAGAPLGRTRAVLSGGHSALFGLRS